MKRLIVVCSLLGIFSCSKSGDEPQDPGGNPGPDPGNNPGGNIALTITTVTPDSAERVPVTISGTGFNTTAGQNLVHIGGLPATITKATATTLEIILPANLSAGDHDVMITANGKQTTKTNAFHLVGWVVSNFAGTGENGQLDGPVDRATFRQPTGMVADAAGNIYVADFNKIRKITPQGDVSTYAGTQMGGSNDGNGTAARFNLISALALDGAGNLYVADQFNHLIRKVSPARDVTTIAGMTEVFGHEDGIGTNAKFSMPFGIAVDPAGSFLYIGDHGNDVIRKIDLSNNQVTTVAGNGTRVRKDDIGLQAGIPGPGNLAFDADGDLIITEKGAGMLRKMTANGTVTTIDGFDARQDVNIQPTHLAFDTDKNIFVVFSGGREIKKYSPNGSSSLFAGAWVGPDLEDGAADIIQFKRPEGIVVMKDENGNNVIYVADSQRKKIKKITKQ